MTDLFSHISLPGGEVVKKFITTSGNKCLEHMEKLSRVRPFAKSFASLLLQSDGFYSLKCKLSWRLRGAKFNRIYIHLVSTPIKIRGQQAVLLPTPATMETDNWEKVEQAKRAGQKTLKSRKGGANIQNNLTNYMNFYEDILPTPTTRDYKGARTSESLEKAGRGETNSLPDFFNQSGKSSQLNPAFVGEMMGFPPDWTVLPFKKTNGKD